MPVVATKVVVYRGQVARFMNTDAKDWARDFAKDVKALAIIEAPIRTGELKAGHYYRVRNRGAMNIVAEVGNKVPHAKFVHEGTHGPITAKGFGPMRPGGNARRNMVFVSRGQLWHLREVRGQRANPWIWRATKTVAKRFGVG